MQMKNWLAAAIVSLALFTGGCASLTKSALPPPPATVEPTPEPAPEPVTPVPEPAPVGSEPVPVTPPPPESPRPPASAEPYSPPPPGVLLPTSWASLPDWSRDTFEDALPAFLTSCTSLKFRAEWQAVCADAGRLSQKDSVAIRRFFENRFIPYAIRNADGNAEGLVTGYYEPLIRGSLKQDGAYRFPLYGVPDDLLNIDVAELYPELKGLRLRGRLEGRKVVPYYTRAEIERGDAAVEGREILWADDAVELFFLQIQGSGRVRLPDGKVIRVGFAEHNGHPYKSIGRLLIERGELTLDKASMQGIKNWGARNPDKLPQLLQENPAYVFFRQLPESDLGPIGALGVPLTAGRSIALDKTLLPLGAPVFLATTWPLSSRPLNRLMMGQDTGSAIRGAVRADFYWGFGEEAGQLAGRMRQSGRMWLLYPRGFDPRLSEDVKP
jgi:membrane-bound lytic murein transglycosylase A